MAVKPAKKTGRVTPPKKSTPSTASSWKKSAKGMPLEVPSGNTALVRNIGLQALVKQGEIPNLLLPIVQQAMQQQKEPSKAQMQEMAATMAQDPAQLLQLVEFVDSIVLQCVIEPKVSPVPENELDRDEDTLYVDEVDWEDKLFISQWVMGGTRDLESFREGLDEGMEDLPPS